MGVKCTLKKEEKPGNPLLSYESNAAMSEPQNKQNNKKIHVI